MYVEDVKDVKDGKRTYRHIFIITFLIWYHLNVMLSMLKMSKIDQIYLRAVMLCMSKMSKIDQIHLRAVMLCMSKMSKIDQIHLRAVNAMYVEDVEDGKRTYTHILAHNFLNT